MVTQQLNGVSPPGGKDASRAALDFVHGELVRGTNDASSLDHLLKRLTKAFGATASGLGEIQAGSLVPSCCTGHDASDATVSLPFAANAATSTELEQGPGAVLLAGLAGEHIAAARVGLQGQLIRFIWIARSAGLPKWTNGEIAALELAALCLARTFAGNDKPRWAKQAQRLDRQRILDLTAQVTRRLAHDFGNILTGILGFSELALGQNVANNSALHSYISEVNKAANAGAMFTHQLRLLSRRQAGTTGTTPLGDFLPDELRRFQTLWGTSCSLRLENEETLPSVPLGAEPLRHILQALLENAREAVSQVTRPGVVIQVRQACLTAEDCADFYGNVLPGPHVDIRVVDNGPGPSAEAARHLFREPFFTTKPHKRGFGLTLVYGLLTAHRGGIDLHAGLHGGAVARMVLPVTDAPIKTKVLVVDDDPLILQFVCTTLLGAGYDVQRATTVAEACQNYAARVPDLVVSDLAMPNENGIDLARRLLNENAKVRLLFMSGHSPTEYAGDECVSHFQFLAKPFRPDGLLRAVREALGRAPVSCEELLLSPSPA